MRRPTTALNRTAFVVLASLAALGTLYLGARRAFAQNNAQPVTLTILGISGWTPSELAGKMAPEFQDYAKQTGGLSVRIKFEGAPFSALEQKAATSLAAHSKEYDIIISDSQWLGALSTPGWIVKLNDIIQREPLLKRAEGSFNTITRWAYQTYPYGSDNLWGLPQEGDVLALYVRNDLARDAKNQAAFKDKYGWKLPTSFEEWEQVTWPKFEQIMGFFNRPDQGLYGFAGEYSKTYDFISDHVMSMMWMWGGEIWDSNAHQVYGILNSPQNNAALEYYIALLKYQPPGANTFDINGVIQSLTQGKAFSGLTWAAVGPAILTPEMKDKIIVVPPPGRIVNGKMVRIYCVGGQPWVVNKFIDRQHMRAALEFLKWWYLPETQMRFARLGGNPVAQYVLDRPGFEQIQPWYREYRYMLVTERARDFWHNPTYASLLEVQQEAWTAYATGVVNSAKVANDYAACGQQKILYDAGFARQAPPSSCEEVRLR
jgi:multiple sugar transport system substrate-binding protein